MGVVGPKRAPLTTTWSYLGGKKTFSMTYLMCSFCIFIFGGIIVYQINGPLKNVISKKHTILFDQNTYHLSCRWRSESGLLLTVRNAQHVFPERSKRNSRHVYSRVNGTSTSPSLHLFPERRHSSCNPIILQISLGLSWIILSERKCRKITARLEMKIFERQFADDYFLNRIALFSFSNLYHK